jgi:hypothetical protein
MPKDSLINIFKVIVRKPIMHERQKAFNIEIFVYLISFKISLVFYQNIIFNSF